MVITFQDNIGSVRESGCITILGYMPLAQYFKNKTTPFRSRSATTRYLQCPVTINKFSALEYG